MGQRTYGANELHDDLVSALYRKPEILGIDRYSVATATTEYEFKKDWQNYVTPDIAYMLHDGRYIFAEVKSTPSKGLLYSARKQMDKVYECCMDLGFEAEGYILQPTVQGSNLERLIKNIVVEQSFSIDQYKGL